VRLNDQPEYLAWKSMHARCGNPRYRNFQNYGGRGIAVHPDFATYEGFLAWLKANRMYPRPADKSLDRMDVNGNYEPGNIKWSTPTEQNRNARSNRLITYAGRTQCLSAWAEHLGMPVKTLYTRIVTRGWPVERAFATPVRVKTR
jgi:hypothetical protein